VCRMRERVSGAGRFGSPVDSPTGCSGVHPGGADDRRSSARAASGPGSESQPTAVLRVSASAHAAERAAASRDAQRTARSSDGRTGGAAPTGCAPSHAASFPASGHAERAGSGAGSSETRGASGAAVQAASRSDGASGHGAHHASPRGASATPSSVPAGAATRRFARAGAAGISSSAVRAGHPACAAAGGSAS
jgi:hypothetical protein